MEKSNSLQRFFTLFLAAIITTVFNSISATPLELKKDGGTGTAPNIMSRSKVMTISSTFSDTVVSADLTLPDLTVFFATPVGTATVFVTDQFGAVVYQTAVSTFSTSEVVIPVDGFDAGNYSLHILYGTTNLIGDFEL